MIIEKQVNRAIAEADADASASENGGVSMTSAHYRQLREAALLGLRLSKQPGLMAMLAERERQVSVENWTPAHDDEHDPGALAAASSAYALAAADQLNPHSQGDGRYDVNAPESWPFDHGWWKPGEPARELVKSGALAAAEFDRILRASAVRA